jgi:hypothetical protein
MLRKLIPAAAILILLTADAYCQLNGGGNTGNSLPMSMGPSEHRRTSEEIQRDREIEAQYNRTVNDKIPDKKSSNDPWGNVRAAPATSSASKQQGR